MNEGNLMVTFIDPTDKFFLVTSFQVILSFILTPFIKKKDIKSNRLQTQFLL